MKIHFTWVLFSQYFSEFFYIISNLKKMIFIHTHNLLIPMLTINYKKLEVTYVLDLQELTVLIVNLGFHFVWTSHLTLFS